MPAGGSSLATITGAGLGPSAQARLSIYVLDVGQGDSTVVLGPVVNGRRRVLIVDAGHYQGVKGRDIVEALLNAHDVDRVDYVVVSHYDADHMGGFTHRTGSSGLLWSVSGSDEAMTCAKTKWFPIEVLVDPGPRSSPNVGTKQWLKCGGDLTNHGQPQYWRVAGGAHIGDVLDLGDGVTARIVTGGGYVWGTPAQIARVNTENEQSIAVLVSDGPEFNFLITGDLIGQDDGGGKEDAELEVVLGQKLASEGIDLEVLRVGHHGAENATEATFLDNTTPEVAIISCGDKQPTNYRHPRCKTYETLDGARVPVILQTETGNTDCAARRPADVIVVDGTIRIEVVTGDGYSISSHGSYGANGRATRALKYRCTSSGCNQLEPSGAACCRICWNSKPCGDSCISAQRNCTTSTGCACSP